MMDKYCEQMNTLQQIYKTRTKCLGVCLCKRKKYDKVEQLQQKEGEIEQ